MISVRVKTQTLEVAISSPNDTLADIIKAAVTVAESHPIQNSLQTPIFLKSVEQPKEQQKQLMVFEPENTTLEKAEMSEPKRKKLASGKGERAIAYNKTKELIDKDFFSTGRQIGEIQQSLSQKGYGVSSRKLADALLMLVRDEVLVREGERGSYTYRKP